MKILSRIAAYLLFATAAMAAPESIESICQSTACRSATTVKQPVDDEHFQKFEFVRSPFVDDGVVSILSGEVIHVKVVQQAGKITALEHSEIPSDLRIGFNVEREPTLGSYLTVTNNLDKPIVYSALVNRARDDWKYAKTSSCPVMARLAAFEHWPYSISMPFLRNFRFAGDEDTSCKLH